MRDKNRILKTTHKIITPLSELLHGKVDKIKYKKGFSNKDIVSDHGTSQVYAKILFKLLELMIMDVIEGYIVYFNKYSTSFLYVDTRPVSQAFIKGEYDKEDMKIPKIDLKVTNYRTPFIAFDPGGHGTPCLVNVPIYLFSLLIEKVNEGKKYAKSTKDFWINKKR